MKATTTSSTSTPVAHNALPPPSAASSTRSSRIAPHSHIKGLGLSAEGIATPEGAGFVGQINAREVCLVCLDPRVHGRVPLFLFFHFVFEVEVGADARLSLS